MGVVALLKRPSWIAGGQALGLGIRKRNEGTTEATQIGRAEARGPHVPTGVGPQRNADLHGTDAGDVLPVLIWLGNEDFIARPQERRQHREFASLGVEVRAKIHKFQFVHHGREVYAGNPRKSLTSFL